MCYTDSDEELWQEDPYEYIRMKFGKSLHHTLCTGQIVSFCFRLYFLISPVCNAEHVAKLAQQL